MRIKSNICKMLSMKNEAMSIVNGLIESKQYGTGNNGNQVEYDTFGRDYPAVDLRRTKVFCYSLTSISHLPISETGIA